MCNAWELGFELVLVEDICSAHDEAQHNGSFQYIFPTPGPRVSQCGSG
ncbi:hypothetical protein [Sodalis-like endosymbiont of Proechinophthirus fluctus]|nr:hypothetical protein [Sodalis-like endosymbiont of Proechinophthirus fluctus]